MVRRCTWTFPAILLVAVVTVFFNPPDRGLTDSSYRIRPARSLDRRAVADRRAVGPAKLKSIAREQTVDANSLAEIKYDGKTPHQIGPRILPNVLNACAQE